MGLKEMQLRTKLFQMSKAVRRGGSSIAHPIQSYWA